MGKAEEHLMEFGRLLNESLKYAFKYNVHPLTIIGVLEVTKMDIVSLVDKDSKEDG